MYSQSANYYQVCKFTDNIGKSKNKAEMRERGRLSLMYFISLIYGFPRCLSGYVTAHKMAILSCNINLILVLLLLIGYNYLASVT